ncbi:homoserine kinase type II [Krasilnikovia cinnamomea]|uniref:Hydroxylysine kinase n=1 Tax=Krasilnikovia cinnamomea TaxID=349313 RepID=A0A4V2G7K6_9ACTN|nr:phosphotransferase [Krasilnikovia cinnamomea]RZU52896.1 homoserine kinase type II [Krasilnikovia cinnamomea]
MPDHDLLRAALRENWHLVPTAITNRRGGILSRSWDVTVGHARYVARLVRPAERPALEAGLAAAGRLRACGIAAGESVRTLGGALTVAISVGALAVLRRVPGRALAGADPVDQQWWGDRLGAVHRALQGYVHPGLGRWNLLDADAAHLSGEPWLRLAVTEAVTAATRLTVTDRLTYGVLHRDPAPEEFVVDPDTGRAGVLDGGASGTGPLVYDVAAAVAYAGGTDAAAELVDGYLAAAPVHSDELDATLPVLLRFRWAAQADWSARRLAECAQAPAAAECRAGAGEALDRARAALRTLSG